MFKRTLSILACASLVLLLAVPVVVVSAPSADAALLPTWFLAEGSTAWGFGTYINIENPNAGPVQIQITYMTAGGALPQSPFLMVGLSRMTINPYSAVGGQDFSTRVDCLGGQTISVDRSMFWMGGPGPESAKELEVASSIGVTAANDNWWLPEGSSAWGFEDWTCIQNPNGAAANCDLTYMIEGFGPFTVHKTVPPFSRASFNMKDDIGSADASLHVRETGGLPIICERAMYRNARRMGHSSIGYSGLSTTIYLAEGTTAWGFTTYLTVQNPLTSDNTITITYMKPSGPVPMTPFVMAGQTRKTIRVNDVLPNTDCSIKVEGTSAVLAERPMYWGGNSVWGEAGHDSIGAGQPHKYWYMPGGDCRSLFETWTCVQNPNGVPITVQIDYLSEAGAAVIGSFTEVIDGQSRKSFNMIDHAPVPGRYAIRVASLNPGLNVIAERATYLWTEAGSLSARTGGEETIGGWNDP